MFVPATIHRPTDCAKLIANRSRKKGDSSRRLEFVGVLRFRRGASLLGGLADYRVGWR